jgi:hypothetical protein
MPQEPANKASGHSGWRVFPAIAIVAIGVLFLLSNLGYPIDFLTHGNWWAVIILLAALAPLSRAIEIYRARGRFDAEAAHSLLGATAIVLVGVMFLLDLDWGVWWPLFVILGGLFTLVPRHRRSRDRGWRRGDEDDASINR